MKFAFAVGLIPPRTYRIQSTLFRYGSSGPTIYRGKPRHQLVQPVDINGDRYFDLMVQFSKNFSDLGFRDYRSWRSYSFRASRTSKTGGIIRTSDLNLYTQSSMFFYQLRGKDGFVPLRGTSAFRFPTLPPSLSVVTNIINPTTSNLTVSISDTELRFNIIITIPKHGVFFLRWSVLSIEIPTGANPVLGRVSVRSARNNNSCSFPRLYQPSIIQA